MPTTTTVQSRRRARQPARKAAAKLTAAQQAQAAEAATTLTATEEAKAAEALAMAVWVNGRRAWMLAEIAKLATKRSHLADVAQLIEKAQRTEDFAERLTIMADVEKRTLELGQ